jgi:hypothetical protein
MEHIRSLIGTQAAWVVNYTIRMLICDYELLEYVGIIIALLESHCFVLIFLMLMCNTTLVLRLEDRI